MVDTLDKAPVRTYLSCREMHEIVPARKGGILNLGKRCDSARTCNSSWEVSIFGYPSDNPISGAASPRVPGPLKESPPFIFRIPVGFHFGISRKLEIPSSGDI